MANILPLPNSQATHVDPKGKPTKEFFNYLKSMNDFANRKSLRVTEFDAGTITTGTFTPNSDNGNYQFLTNNGAFTIAAPLFSGGIDILVTNGASAGSITFSGYTVATGNTGDLLDTTSGNKFLISLRMINGTATYLIKALQ